MKEVILRTILLMFILTSSTHFVEANTYLTENSTWSAELTGSFWASIALGDADNDGDLDLAQIGCTSTSGSACNGYLSKIYVNNGVNLSENSTWEENLTAVNYGSIAWADVDNDGDLDLALTGCSNGGGNTASCNTPASFISPQNFSTSSIKKSSKLATLGINGSVALVIANPPEIVPMSNAYHSVGL